MRASVGDQQRQRWAHRYVAVKDPVSKSWHAVRQRDFMRAHRDKRMLRTLCGEWIDMLLTGAQLGCGDVERCRKCRSEMEVRGLRVVRLSKQARRQLALDALGAE